MKKQRYTLTKEQQEHLQRSLGVRKVSARMVQYTADFKEQVLATATGGRSVHDVFTEAGIPLTWFEKDYVRHRLRAWRQIAKRHGLEHFQTDARGAKAQIGGYRQMSDREKVSHLEMKVEALEYVRRHFQLPPVIVWKPRTSHRRRNTK